MLLNRDHRHAEALTFLEAGMERFPTYEPFFTNALTSARGAGRPDLVRDLQKKGKSAAQADPFFLFAKGLSFYQDAHFDLAASELSRAHDAKPDSPVILAWLTRVPHGGPPRARPRLVPAPAGDGAAGDAAHQRSAEAVPLPRASALTDQERHAGRTRAPPSLLDPSRRLPRGPSLG